MSREVVSVIIPTRNRCQQVQQAIASVHGQTYPNVELVVVDDGSTDGTSIALSQADDLVYIQQPALGQAAARSRGLGRSRGRYVCTLDSDDVWRPDFLERSIEAMQQLRADFVFSNWVAVDQHGRESESYLQTGYRWWEFPKARRLPAWRAIDPDRARALYVDSCPSPSSALMFRREMLPPCWMEELAIGDDWGLVLEMVVSRPCHGFFLMEPMWRKHTGSDNIYDERGWEEIRRLLYVGDLSSIVVRLGDRLRGDERARLNALIAYHQMTLALYLIRRARPSGLWHGLSSGLRLFRGFLSSPMHVVDRLRLLVGNTRHSA